MSMHKIALLFCLILSCSLFNVVRANTGDSLFGTQLEEFLRACSDVEDYEHTLQMTPRAVIELKLRVQGVPVKVNSTEILHLAARLEQFTNETWTEIGEPEVVQMGIFPTAFTVTEWDLVDLGYADTDTPLRIRFTSDSPVPVAFEFSVLHLDSVGRHQVIIAGIILVLTYTVIVFELVHRTLAAMLGAMVTLIMLTILRERPSSEHIVSWIDEGTIGLLLGMMIMIGVFSTTGFFEFGAVKAFKLSKGKVWRLVAILCALTATLSAFLDNVTTMLLIAPVTLRLSKVVNLPPVPILLAEVFFSNIGGTATMIGDPPNIMIGSVLSDELDFIDFIANLAPVLIVFVFPLCLLLTRFMFRNQLQDRPCDAEIIAELEAEYKIHDMKLFIKVVCVLALTVLLFFLEPVAHVEPAWAALAGAAVLLTIATPKEIEKFLERVEWSTLIFFAGLFVLVEGLAEMGLIRTIGNGVAALIKLSDPDSRLIVAMVLLLWVSAICSAFIDNIPYTATMIPVIIQLSTDDELDLPLKPLAWALAFGACLGGNGTLIGASANVVTCGIAEQAGYRIKFVTFMLYGMPIMFLSVTIVTVYCVLFYGVGGFWHT